jgi:hypothetical protein
LRQAWYQAEQQLLANQQQASSPDPAVEAAAPDAAAPSKDDIETPQLQWNA